MVDYSSNFQVDLDGVYTKRKYRELKKFLSERREDSEKVSKGSSLDNIVKTRRVIRARTALEAGIAKWKDKRSLKFMTLTLDPERASFSKTYINGGFSACWSAFIKRIRRVFGEIDYVGITVRDKFGGFIHKHLIINAGWINQRLLSDYWEEITFNPVLDIRTLWFGRGLRNYLVNYLGNQGRLGYSLNWVFPQWRYMSSKIFANLKRRYLPYYMASPYCANIFYRYVWYRRVLPFLIKEFNTKMLNWLPYVKYPILLGNWEPRLI